MNLNRVFRDISPGAGDTRRRPDGREATAAAQEQLSEWGRSVEQFIADHPKIALGAAVSLGVLLGWWIKRR